jgi:hypothetical protein
LWEAVKSINVRENAQLGCYDFVDVMDGGLTGLGGLAGLVGFN